MEKEYQAQVEKLAAIEVQKKEAEESYKLDLGSMYYQIQKMKNKKVTLAEVHASLKNELKLLKEERKKQRLENKADGEI